ncbi:MULTISPECIES: nitrogen fixation protein FixF [Alphaproteobacteria]|uniref:Protein FixF n=2 Tax=Alphaproteobacteria TaxID=28211 RepID=A0A512HEK7_9HYPH|nr:MULTISPECIES: nitrogen fixation protein FixF [Alphaproteobacteria]GEO83884.1 protein FixF [Ciceribacter naphthalenivorans]GLR21238.1 protein FixF [Ciceribacter naphthalenivorans]GLT04094.1 protein FixF [Sphingomonas psychrolutea]
MGDKDFIICRTSHLRGFISRFGDRVAALPSDLKSTTMGVAGSQGVAGLLRAIFVNDDPVLDALTERNLKRRQIRFRAVFSNPLVAWAYRKATQVQCRLTARAFETWLEQNPRASVVVFNGYLMPDSILAAIAAKHKRSMVFLEKGFFPGTLQCDPAGINYQSSLPRDPAFYRALDPADLGDKPTALVKRQSKLKDEGPTSLPARYVFVPFQVPSDMQILALSPWIRDMRHLYEEIFKLAEAERQSHFVIKEHPSFPLSVRGEVTPHPRIHFANHHDTQTLIEGADAVITVNSTVGLESVLLEKKVITLGLAPYDIEGLALKAGDAAALLAVFRSLVRWQPDPELRERVIRYIQNIFLLQGELRNPDQQLPDMIATRLAGTDRHRQALTAFAKAKRES